jgi:hypothetical protein
MIVISLEMSDEPKMLHFLYESITKDINLRNLYI